MRIAAIREYFDSRSGVYGKYTDASRNALQVIQNIVEQWRLNMLQHIDARDKTARLCRHRPLRNRRIIVMYRQWLLRVLSQGHAEAPLACAVVEQFRGAHRIHHLRYQRRILNRRHPVVRVLVQFLLHATVVFADKRGCGIAHWMHKMRLARGTIRHDWVPRLRLQLSRNPSGMVNPQLFFDQGEFAAIARRKISVMSETTSLWALFVSSFLAATLLPGGSEAVLFGVLKLHPDQVWPALAAATLGNTLGGMSSYLIGRIMPQKQEIKGLAAVQRYGAPVLLLSWVPIIGDPLCVAAGWLRMNPWWSALCIASGKFVRYCVIAMLAV